MFGLGKKKPYEELVRHALDSNQVAEAQRIATEAFSLKQADEEMLAWISSVLYERGVSCAPDFLEQFVQRHPSSLHLPRVYLADALSQNDSYDLATDHARTYLRLSKDAGVFTDLGSRRILREGVSKAHLLMTAAYTELGSRSYSERLLRHGLNLGMTEKWTQTINDELNRLATEKRNAKELDMDHQWEKFYSTGEGASPLHEMCIANRYPLMAKRIDLIESNFRWNSSFTLDDNEMLMLVMAGELNTFILR